MPCHRPWASWMPFAEGEVWARITWLKMWTVEAPVLGVLLDILLSYDEVVDGECWWGCTGS